METHGGGGGDPSTLQCPNLLSMYICRNTNYEVPEHLEKSKENADLSAIDLTSWLTFFSGFWAFSVSLSVPSLLKASMAIATNRLPRGREKEIMKEKMSLTHYKFV